MNILITEFMPKPGLDRLQTFTSLLYDEDLWNRREELLQHIKDADALVVRNQTRVNRELLDRCGRLNVIGRLGVGVDNIDVDYVQKKGFVLTYAGPANCLSVSEFVISMIMILSRPILVEANRHVQSGNWDRKSFYGKEIYKKKLGLIGLGNIGSRVARRALAFGMDVYVYDPFIPEFHFMFEEYPIHRVDFDCLLKQSDYVSIQINLVQSTRNMIRKDQLSTMKKSAFLINVSRGGIVDEVALYEALRDKTIAGAALDVREQEPPPSEHPLHDLDNCFLTPHVAGLTEEAQNRTSIIVADDVIKVLQGEKPLFPYMDIN